MNPGVDYLVVTIPAIPATVLAFLVFMIVKGWGQRRASGDHESQTSNAGCIAAAVTWIPVVVGGIVWLFG